MSLAPAATAREAEPGSAAAPRPPARPRRLAAGAVAVGAVLIGVAVSALLLWAPRPELTAGPSAFSGETAVVTVPGYGDLRGTSVVDYRDGAAVEVTVPLRNDGRLPVEVTSVTPVSGILPLLEVRSVGGLPLSLSPGEQGEVVLRAVLTSCRYYHERQVQNLSELLVQARVGVGPVRRATSATLPLHRPLLVHSPMIVGCPDRKLDRQADNRRDAL